MAGPLKTLYQMLKTSAYMQGVSVIFGEENINAQEQALPMVVIVPQGGPYEQSAGYQRSSDSNIEALWGTTETIDVKCWAWSSLPNAEPVDHADAVESLLPLVLSAFQDQRMNQGFVGASDSGGLYYKPVYGRWELMQNALIRYGRCYTLTFQVDKTYPMLPPPEVIDPTLSISASITVPT